MTRILFISMSCFVILGFLVKNEYAAIKINKKIVDGPSYAIPPMAKKLMECYKDHIIGFSNNYLIFKDSTRLVWDDGKKNKSFTGLLTDPDMKDMFAQAYLKGAQQNFPSANNDPGRIRNEAFFKKIYGSTERAVQNNLTEIVWCPHSIRQKIKVTTVNGIDKKLLQVSKELEDHPELKKYISTIGGTFNWRFISGTSRHSMHSFGMTIDVNTAFSNYWQWDCKCTNENAVLKYKNQIPQLMVDIFERHGFIWGGKWYHYDTMHFEYRPELL